MTEFDIREPLEGELPPPFKVFICAPYRADNWVGVAKNITLAREIAEWVASEGMYPFTPHLNTQLFDSNVPALYPDKPYTEDLYLAGCQSFLRECDALFILDDDTVSIGMQGEIALAESCNIPITGFKKKLLSLFAAWKGD